ncbi:MAG TPA: ribosome assembly factor SBDS [Candidatus Nanoarchaeia archaeon]|nr:ribosome assembly factor SBDS [Candidatus Nanoarchaeia archaeon]
MGDSLNLARLKKASDVFEIVVNPDKAIYFRKHPESNIRDALVYPKIYSDVKKGILPSEQKLQAVFGTTDPLEVSKQIIMKGDIQVTAEYRKQLLEQKRRQIIEMIRKQGVDPRTNAPHPLTRIEAALEQSKAKIDEYKPAETQVQEILKQLRPILPIKMVTKEIDITIPAQYAQKAHPIIKHFAKILRENWENDGSWHGMIEIPGGLETDLYDKLNNIAHGSVQAKLISTKGE